MRVGGGLASSTFMSRRLWKIDVRLARHACRITDLAITAKQFPFFKNRQFKSDRDFPVATHWPYDLTPSWNGKFDILA
jgi:hypothetical protein